MIKDLPLVAILLGLMAPCVSFNSTQAGEATRLVHTPHGDVDEQGSSSQTDAGAKHKQSAKPDRGPKQTGSVLVFSGTGWYRHPETAAISGWLARLSDDVGMQVDVTETPKDLRAMLDRYDVLVLNNSNELTKLFDEGLRDQIRDWYRQGGGIVALHAALVHQTEWQWLHQLAGCDFNSDSEFLEARVVVDPENRDHPTVRGQDASFQYTADWTNHTRSVSGLPGFRVLLRVDESSFEPVRDHFKTRGGKPMGEDHPIAWLHENEGGRFFYTELGHDVRSLETDFGRQHIVEAIRWAARFEAIEIAVAIYSRFPTSHARICLIRSTEIRERRR